MRILPSSALALLLSVASAGALAQPSGRTPSSRNPGASAAPAMAGMMQSGPTGSLQKMHDSWRSSQLVGATIYNDAGATLGTIDNLLIGDDGKVDQAVLSVGGFLGVGSKLVSVPFDQLKFEPSRQTMAGATPVATTGMTAPSTAMAGVNGVAPAPAPAASGSAASPAYFSIIMPGATKDSLGAMAAFSYTG